MPRLALFCVALLLLLLGRTWQWGSGFCDSGCDDWSHADWLVTSVVLVPAVALVCITAEWLLAAERHREHRGR